MLLKKYLKVSGKLKPDVAWPFTHSLFFFLTFIFSCPTQRQFFPKFFPFFGRGGGGKEPKLDH